MIYFAKDFIIMRWQRLEQKLVSQGCSQGCSRPLREGNVKRARKSTPTKKPNIRPQKQR